MKNEVVIRFRTPVNRKEKRKASLEYEAIKSWYEKYVVPMEVAFFNCINTESKSYQDVYDEFSFQFERAIMKLTCDKNLVFFSVNYKYFKLIYEPVEKEK